jgi:hypothetical protein
MNLDALVGAKQAINVEPLSRMPQRAGFEWSWLMSVWSTADPSRVDTGSSQNEDSKFRGNLLSWPINGGTRAFRVYIVEPETYCPEHHGEIFNAALTSLINPEYSLLDPYAKSPGSASTKPFGLLTFPEAFLPQCDLLSALRLIASVEPFGCVHVGLRPSKASNLHLFKVDELRNLVNSLLDIPRIVCADLAPFSDWLDKQPDELSFNIGCLFTLDTSGQLRVCLHPKLIRSRFERSALHEQHMGEANLLTLVTLLPADKTYLSLTLQPLLCSDALHLDTDRPGGRPLEAVNADAKYLGATPPDHIDIVCIATCTQQQEQPTSKAGHYRMWHQEFRDTFRSAASHDALARHHYAVFVLSNFRTVPGFSCAGLSGGPADPLHRCTRHAPTQLRHSVANSPVGTSKNHHRSRAAWNLLANDSGLFPFRFCAVHPKDSGDCKPLQYFEVPLWLSSGAWAFSARHAGTAAVTLKAGRCDGRFGLLQRHAHTPGSGQGCAVTPSHRAIWHHCPHTNSVRTASSLCADMIFGEGERLPTTHAARGRVLPRLRACLRLWPGVI